MQDEECMDLVSEAKTTDLPEGCLLTAWEALLIKFEPKDIASKISLQDDFANLKLSPNASADKWIQKMKSIRRKLTKDFGSNNQR